MNWKEKDQSEGLGRVFVTEQIARIQQVKFDASKLHESHQMAAQYNMVDDGSGETQVSYNHCCLSDMCKCVSATHFNFKYC